MFKDIAETNAFAFCSMVKQHDARFRVSYDAWHKQSLSFFEEQADGGYVFVWVCHRDNKVHGEVHIQKQLEGRHIQQVIRSMQGGEPLDKTKEMLDYLFKWI